MSAQKSKNSVPDFAYPKQVIKDADAMLDKALRAGDGTAVVNALIRSGLAQTAISPDSLPSVIYRIEGIAAKEKNAVTHALLDLLLADIYTQYYDGDSYNLNRRPALATPGSDITLWSGKEFKDRIVELYNHALTHAAALKKARITDYSAIIDCDKTDAIFYPTLFDFASLRAVDGISGLTDESLQVLSPIFLYDIRLRVPNVLAKPSRDAIEIANRWVDAGQGAPRVAALLTRYEMLEDYVVEDDTDDDDGSENLTTPLMRLYEENRSTPYAVEFLIGENLYSLSAGQKTALYRALKDFEASNPSYFRINAVKNILAELSQPAVRLQFPAQVIRGKEFKVDVSMSNVASTELLVYRVKNPRPGYNDGSYILKDCASAPETRIPVKSDGVIPFTDKKEVPLTLDEYGVYILTSSLKKAGQRDWYTPVYCSDMALLGTNGTDLLRVFAVSGLDGAPVTGADVTTYRYDNGVPVKLRTRETGADGYVDLNKGNLRNIFIHAVKGDDRYGAGMTEYLYDYRGENSATTAFIRTSLAIYHPGDTLDFVAVAYNYSGNTRTLVKNTELKAILRNPNYVAVDTVDIRTDDYGRASARFTLPDEGLTGYFMIGILNPATKRQIASESVMVSDYKLPTYEAKVDSVTVNDADGSVTVLGKAATYSGFPVQNAIVEASLSGMQRVWWRSNTVKFHTDTLSTDADGAFRWVLSKEVLNQSPFRGGRYEVSFTVTSPSGENRSCRDDFSLSKQAYISVDDNGWFPAANDARLDIAVFNPLGEKIESPVHLSFKDKDSKEYEFDAVSRNGFAVADLSNLRSGQYSLTVKAAGIDAMPTEAKVIIYNSGDMACPVASGIWAPFASVKANATDRKAEIVYGIPAEQPHVLMTVYRGTNLIEQKWIDARSGMNRLTVNVPDSLDEMSVRLSTVNNFSEWSRIFKVTVDNPDATLKVKIEHMRDRLNPLADETVTVKVTNGAGKGVGAALILDMYSKALDNLATQSWTFSPSSGYIGSLSLDNNLRGFGANDFSSSVRSLTVPALGVPSFNFYGLSWSGYGRNGVVMYDMLKVRGSAPRMMKAESVMYDMEVVEEEVADLGAVSEHKEALYGSAAGVAVDNDGLQLQETVVAAFSTVSKTQEQYRPAEVPLAFFAPMLTTDADGNLTYSFTVPNANTTWVLNALAYTDLLATGLDMREAIASKPVMVEPNLPRFLRTGDVADIRATVMNSTDAPASVTTTFEILDSATGEIVGTQSVDSEIAPRQSATVKFSIAAPATPGAMMVRVKSSTESYSDGVMTLLPVLSSSQPVIDASTFYLAPDQKELTRELPAPSADSKVTLSFCENPTWEVVSALPGLRADDAATSLAASAQVFAAAVSRYVLQLNPAIEPALKEWLASGKEGEMLSMLNRNDDLKQLVLAATPWVQDAQSDEERISRLALLFDSKEIDRSIKSAVNKLEKMQRDGGGWSWTDNYDRPSEWATMLILNNFAELRQLGCCPSQLDGMVKKALKYIDAEVAKDYARYPDSDYSYYTYVRSLYRDVPLSTGAQKAYNATVQRTLKDWKKSSTPAKAADALMLYRNDYKEVARQILASIREYAVSTPELGMWWDSVDGSSWRSLTAVGQTAFILQAFNTIEPGCAEIDPIRQWLILNKIVQDWGTSVDASACVAAILQCGSSWLNRPGDAVITVDGKRLEADRMDRLTGQVIAAIPDAKGNLKITRTAEGPAWGAVVSQSTQVMKDVKAHSIPELSVSKELFVRTDKGWAPAETFSVGQVVKVRLVMKSMRDMDYVTLVDNRAATFEPVIQTPRPVYCDGLVFYLENRDAATNLFIDRMPKGQYVIEYEMNVNNAGTYSSGIATLQSQYAPEMTAHSAGTALTVTD